MQLTNPQPNPNSTLTL